MIGFYLLVAGIALFWLGVLARVGKARREGRWRLGPDAPVDVELPELSVVIPARNEARTLPSCLDALRRSDHPRVGVLVFDDASTDGTGEIARARGVEVRVGEGSPPEGWKGKTWALHRATRELRTDWILFLDADVEVQPEALSRAHAYALRENLDFLSGFGRLTMGGFWEKVIQPSVGGLILAGNDLDAVNDPARTDRVIANGQFILVRRSAYEAVGDHGAVKADILDDVGLAKAFVAKGLALRCLLMRELFSCRMYTSLRELWDGWTKNLYAGLEYRPDRVVFLSAFVAFEFLLPYGLLVSAAVDGRPERVLPAAGLVALIHGVRAWMDRIFGQDLRYGLLQPLGAAALIALLLESMRRSRAGAVVWKGRTYAVGSASPPPRALVLLGLLPPLLVFGAWTREALARVAEHERAIRPLGGLAYATFVQLCHNWTSGAGWTQTVHRGYADEWRWGGHYTPLLPVVAWLSSWSESPWALARVQVVAVGLGVFAAWKLGKDEAGLSGAIVGAAIYAGSGAVAMLALADYQDLVLLVPLAPLLVWAARHAHLAIFLLAGALYASAREEAILLLPFVAASGGWRRALAGAAVSAVFIGIYAWLPPPAYPNPLRDILAWQTSRATSDLGAFANADWNFYGTMASTGWPWMAAAPVTALAGLPVLGFHALDPTSIEGLRSPAIHHLAPFAGVAVAAGIVGACRILRVARAGGILVLAAVLATTWTSFGRWEIPLRAYGARAGAPHPAWDLLAQVPTDAVLLLPEDLAPAGARRRWVVTPDSVGDRVQPGQVGWAIDDGRGKGTVVAESGGWRLLKDPVVTGRSHDHGPAQPGRQ